MKQHTRYRLVDTPVLSPGNDLITLSVNGPFIDTGYDVTFEQGKQGARVYLSVATIKEMAEIAGLFDAPEGDDNEAYRLGYEDATRENVSGQLNDVVARLYGIAATLHGALGDPMAVTAAEPGTAEAVPPVAEAAEPAGEQEGGDPVDIEPSTSRQGSRSRGDKRPTGVSGNTGDDASLRL